MSGSGEGEGVGVAAPFPDDLGLATVQGDGVVVLAPGGTIVWANEAFAAILGRPLVEVVGTDGLAIVHPEELARALDGIVFVARFPGRTSVAPYRLRHGDGHWLDVELKAAILPRDGADHLVMAVRDGTTRQGVNRALQSVANGEPLERTAELVTRVVTGRWAGTAAAVTIGSLDGGRQVHGPRLPDLLAEHAAGRLATDAAPWERCRDGKVAVVERSELSPALAACAAELGYESYAAAWVDDPTGEPACLLVWFDHIAIAHLEFTHAAAELTELLSLALERRLHLWQLWYVARHDVLTEVLNRNGFQERFDADVATARRAGDRTTVVLYIDLDGLKAVNDRDGHAAGDRVLVDAARRLVDVVGDAGVVARLGGDEFVVSVAFADHEALDRGRALADRVVAALRIPVGDLQVAASVGVVVDDGAAGPSRLLERADAAMYRAKSGGRSRWAE